MDKLLPDELQYYIDTMRIRTARRRLRTVKTEKDKQLIQLDKRLRALWRQDRHPEYVPLEPPVQKGYKRFFILRDDVARGKQALFFQGILDKINTVQYFHRKDFKVKKRQKGKKVMVVKEQDVRTFYRDEFNKLKLTRDELSYFEERMVPTRWKGEVPQMVFTEPWRFVLRIRPHLLTHVRKANPELDSQIQEIENYMDKHYLRPRMRWLTQSRHSSWNKKLFGPKEKYQYQKKPLPQLLQEIYYNIE